MKRDTPVEEAHRAAQAAHTLYRETFLPGPSDKSFYLFISPSPPSSPFLGAIELANKDLWLMLQVLFLAGERPADAPNYLTVANPMYLLNRERPENIENFPPIQWIIENRVHPFGRLHTFVKDSAVPVTVRQEMMIPSNDSRQVKSLRIHSPESLYIELFLSKEAGGLSREVELWKSTTLTRTNLCDLIIHTTPLQDRKKIFKSLVPLAPKWAGELLAETNRGSYFAEAPEVEAINTRQATAAVLAKVQDRLLRQKLFEKFGSSPKAPS